MAVAPKLMDIIDGGLQMRRFSLIIAFSAVTVATTALAADDYRVVDHLQIVKTGDARTAPIQPTALTDDLTRDDIAAVQKCKDLGPASDDPDAEAEIINRCLDQNSVLNLKVIPNQVKIKAVLR